MLAPNPHWLFALVNHHLGGGNVSFYREIRLRIRAAIKLACLNYRYSKPWGCVLHIEAHSICNFVHLAGWHALKKQKRAE